MGGFVVRYQTTPEAAEENQQLVKAVFAELAEAAPTAFGYASFRLADGVSFVHVGYSDGPDNPLGSLAAFKAFASGMAERAPEGATPSGAEMIGCYGFDTGSRP